ncbi:substrate-binding domain-containing protein [Nocardioides sp. ChNu-153]|uniref:substrate-binding domain-containing protein n=1 Tax=unclassified Nocardioides TaxID=2615069 RepID=UPI002406CFA9|nr:MULTISPECIES: substrate-binding domain-containing protein [unclassified Nocardioides]MDF9715877.1 substrate-binding domain-containing protein [Nocardioides sp. ChNu-99]MDN7120978.1 substrate-binding domain-containing protein [Nocardioides sp. ChNu-153]
MSRAPHLRRLAPLAVAASLCLVASACGSDSSSGSGGGDGSVAAVIKGLDNPFFQQMEAGIDAGAQDGDLEVDVQAAADITDTTGQLDKLNVVAGQDPGCVIVNPIDGTNLVQGLAALAAKDVPIVNIDSPVDADAASQADATPATYIGTDNTEAGRMAGEHMLTLLPEGGDVALIGGIAGDVTSNARLDGFTEAAGDGVSIVQTVSANWSRDEALTQATTLLRANPELAGFFVANDDMALGVARAVSDVGRTGEVEIISVDGVEDGLNGVAEGGISAVVAQYPYAIGEMGVNACRAAIAGEDLPEEVTAPIALVTADNVQDALDAAPAPFEEYDDPFAALVD